MHDFFASSRPRLFHTNFGHIDESYSCFVLCAAYAILIEAAYKNYSRDGIVEIRAGAAEKSLHWPDLLCASDIRAVTFNGINPILARCPRIKPNLQSIVRI